MAIPAASRSWIGKAHLIEATLQAVYIHQPSTTTTTPPTPAGETKNNEYNWVVITNGTPASCVQLGLYNLFPDRGAIDLVISGPNHGRNASTIYNLSSGTVGGALEAATCGKRAIAISFGSKDPQPVETIEAAARLAVRVVQGLVRNWDARVELYNLNIPMRGDVETRPVRYTRALPYSWTRGLLYSEIDRGHVNGHVDEKVNGVNEVHEVNGHDKMNGNLKTRDFKWSAELSDMKKALQAAEEGTDAHTVLSGCTRYSLYPPVLFYLSLPLVWSNLVWSVANKALVSLPFWRTSGIFPV